MRKKPDGLASGNSGNRLIQGSMGENQTKTQKGARATKRNTPVNREPGLEEGSLRKQRKKMPVRKDELT